MKKEFRQKGGCVKDTEPGGVVLSGTYANAMTDFMFKRLFGSKRIMLTFLNALLPDVGIVDLNYIGTENQGEQPDDRKAIFDLACITSSGHEVIIEMQMAEQKYLKKRAVAYSAYPIVRQARMIREASLSGGKNFRWDFDLHPVYFVGILNFSLEHEEGWPEGNYISRYELMEKSTGEVMTDTLKYVFVELGRFFKRESDCGTFMDMLAYSMKLMHQFNDIPSSFDNEVIKYLYKLSEMFNFTEEELNAYKKSLKMNWDLKNIEDYAREKGYKAGHAEGRADGHAEGRAEGHAEGHAEGRAEGELAAKRSTAKKLIAMGVSPEMVSEATGLTLQELSEL